MAIPASTTHAARTTWETATENDGKQAKNEPPHAQPTLVEERGDTSEMRATMRHEQGDGDDEDGNENDENKAIPRRASKHGDERSE